ncbi:hypothetical protein K0M31_009257 [Melipona bicolor]|uniref:Uncharacterized protein n=1 Tax=Melipona bicolor TaxID=60889 RepID=A0AA40KJL0_9HYME|nr:hypothetical protein K0M31_009257 [Melipona bicolor]
MYSTWKSREFVQRERFKYSGCQAYNIKTKRIRLMASSGSKVREKERERLGREEVVQPRKSRLEETRRKGTRWLLKYSHLKPPKVVLTVTSIQRAQGPGDARPPENCGHVTDPPHPDP